MPVSKATSDFWDSERRDTNHTQKVIKAQNARMVREMMQHPMDCSAAELQEFLDACAEMLAFLEKDEAGADDEPEGSD